MHFFTIPWVPSPKIIRVVLYLCSNLGVVSRNGAHLASDFELHSDLEKNLTVNMAREITLSG